ncbi:hypothetical protein [Paractinoplanes maris]|uniref:hypothetical protein n=1 Tax=Paractinoplanes maris TaxID=1734446 RepID=UPI002020FDFF|nr:hypothetical protein [Actinoplanes maris]
MSPDDEHSNTPSVDARHSQGVQVGTGNTQIINHRGLVAVVMASLAVVALAIAGGIYLARDGTGPRAGSAKAEATAPTAPDPFLYVATGNGLHLSRQQTCDGLFGLCLGQTIDFALQAFGPSEADGYPQAGGNEGGRTEVCHGWTPKQIDLITVCAADGAIEMIRVDSSSASPMRIAAPEGNTVTLAELAKEEAAAVTAKLGDKPYSSEYLTGEGESIFSFSWYLKPPPDGPSDTVMHLIGRLPQFPSDLPEPCPGQTEIHYPYNSLLPLSAKATIMTVEVTTTDYALRGESPVPC